MDRTLILRSSLAALAAAAVLLFSAQRVPAAHASFGGCTVTCADKSSCSSDPGTGEKCTCTCGLWGNASAECTCTKLAADVPG